ncbi:efflux RND transporter periplasmic adaptor subunit [Geovibrio ferrireducens]|uniref:efflux RND transporter periplasmic adaptor subunit n=1 Tax=Geovibrio ferrireducens TaxID=46201 RepID=UPI00224536EE|nr:efflux RND transporter periplasmic adaptor subunit [Geovibrio ferrireducens]
MRKSLTLFMILFVLWGCGKNSETAEEAYIPVKTAKVKRVNDNVTVSAGGSITSQDAPVKLSFLASGRVSRIIPAEGDFVRRGDLIAEIDAADYILALQRAQAQRDMALAASEKAESSVRPEQLEQARIAYERAKDEHARMKMLYDSGSLAPNDYLKFRAAYESAENQYEMAKNGGQKEDKKQAAAALKQAEAALASALKSLNDTKLYALSDGYVSKRFIAAGETVSSGYPVVETVRLDPVDVSAGVPEKDIRLISTGQTVKVRLAGIPGQVFEGRVRVVNVSADPATRTYLVKTEVHNPDRLLKIGMAADISVSTDERADMLTVPLNAVVRDAQGAPAVFAVKENRAYAVRVETGRLYNTDIEIKSGLTGDETIVTAGQERLRDGNSVKTAAE